jgi:hypothetical protein
MNSNECNSSKPSASTTQHISGHEVYRVVIVICTSGRVASGRYEQRNNQGLAFNPGASGFERLHCLHADGRHRSNARLTAVP